MIETKVKYERDRGAGVCSFHKLNLENDITLHSTLGGTDIVIEKEHIRIILNRKEAIKLIDFMIYIGLVELEDIICDIYT